MPSGTTPSGGAPESGVYSPGRGAKPMKILGSEQAFIPAAAFSARVERSRMEREISTIFDRLFAPTHPYRAVADRGWHPFTDVYENAAHFFVRMELAGIDA